MFIKIITLKSTTNINVNLENWYRLYEIDKQMYDDLNRVEYYLFFFFLSSIVELKRRHAMKDVFFPNPLFLRLCVNEFCFECSREVCVTYDDPERPLRMNSAKRTNTCRRYALS